MSELLSEEVKTMLGSVDIDAEPEAELVAQLSTDEVLRRLQNHRQDMVRQSLEDRRATLCI